MSHKESNRSLRIELKPEAMNLSPNLTSKGVKFKEESGKE